MWVVDGEQIAIAALAFDVNPLPTLDLLYVLFDHRGRGVGRMLCRAALERFMEVRRRVSPMRDSERFLQLVAAFLDKVV